MANVTGWTQKVAPVQYVTTPFQSVQYVTMKGPAPAAPPAQYVRYMPPAPQTQKVVRVMTPAPTHVLPKTVGLDFNLESGQAPIIVNVEPGSPASNAGLLPGDRILSVSSTKMPTRAETKGMGSEQFSGLLKQTFHDATKAGGKMILQVERGWNGGGVGWEFLAEVGNMQMHPPMTPSYIYMSAPPVMQTAPPMVQYVNGPGYADPYYTPAPSYLDYGYPSFDPSYGLGSEPGIYDYGYDAYPIYRGYN